MRNTPAQLLGQGDPALHPAQDIRVHRRVCQIALVVEPALPLADGQPSRAIATQDTQRRQVDLQEVAVGRVDALAGNVDDFVGAMHVNLHH